LEKNKGGLYIRQKIKVNTKYDKDATLGHYVLPVNRNRLLAVIMKENKSSVWKWVSYRKDSFSVDGHTYFITDTGVYSNYGKLIAVYLEGVSTPISHKYITKEYEKRTAVNHLGMKITRTVQVIKGLKFDSQLIDIVLNRKLADVFTKQSIDLPNLIIIILLIGTLILGVASTFLSYTGSGL